MNFSNELRHLECPDLEITAPKTLLGFSCQRDMVEMFTLFSIIFLDRTKKCFDKYLLNRTSLKRTLHTTDAGDFKLEIQFFIKDLAAFLHTRLYRKKCATILRFKCARTKCTVVNHDKKMVIRFQT